MNRQPRVRERDCLPKYERIPEDVSTDTLREQARLPIGNPRRERAIVELSRRLVEAMDGRWQKLMAEQGTGQLETGIDTGPQDIEDQ